MTYVIDVEARWKSHFHLACSDESMNGFIQSFLKEQLSIQINHAEVLMAVGDSPVMPARGTGTQLTLLCFPFTLEE